MHCMNTHACVERGREVGWKLKVKLKTNWHSTHQPLVMYTSVRAPIIILDKFLIIIKLYNPFHACTSHHSYTCTSSRCLGEALHLTLLEWVLLEHIAITLDEFVPIYTNFIHFFICQHTTVHHGFKVHLWHYDVMWIRIVCDQKKWWGVLTVEVSRLANWSIVRTSETVSRIDRTHYLWCNGDIINLSNKLEAVCVVTFRGKKFKDGFLSLPFCLWDTCKHLWTNRLCPW